MSYYGYGAPDGGLGALQATLALDYMHFVDDEITRLNDDILKQTQPGSPPNMIGQAFLGAWASFLNDPDPQDADVPVKGWRTWRHSNSSLYSRLLHSDYVMMRTGEFERAYVEFYHTFQSLGGHPSQPLPVEPGRPSAELIQKEREERAAEPTITEIAKFGIIVGAITVAGYFIVTREVPKVIAKAFEHRRATR